ncbi:bile acid:sodium symporter family protein [Corynebacterium sp. 335C]
MDTPTTTSRRGAGAEAGRGSAMLMASTVFPLIVLAAALWGWLSPGTWTPLAPHVPILLGIIMLCMGMTLTPPDLRSVARRPGVVALGIVAQFVIMPLTAWAIAKALNLPPELAAGLILVGCAPGGTSSNVMTYLARGDVGVSVAVTTCSTLLAPLLTPVLTLWLAGTYMEVDAASMVGSIIKTVIVPVAVGVVIRIVARRLVEKLQPAFPWISGIVIAMIVGTVVAGSADKIVSAGLIVLVAVVLHNGAGLALGWAAGRAAGLDRATRRALSFEVGLQNSGLAATLAGQYLTPLAALPAAVFSLWHNLSGAFVASVMARRG